MAFGFTSRQTYPWAGLPAGGGPWEAPQNWQAAQQAPWRMTPWQTQAMPSAAPVAAPPMPPPLPTPAPMPLGTSGDIPGFQPGVPGGGFYPQQAAPAPTPPAPPAAPVAYMGGGQLFTDPFAAQRRHSEYGTAGSMQPVNTAQLRQMALENSASMPPSMLQQLGLPPMILPRAGH